MNKLQKFVNHQQIVTLNQQEKGTEYQNKHSVRRECGEIEYVRFIRCLWVGAPSRITVFKERISLTTFK